MVSTRILQIDRSNSVLKIFSQKKSQFLADIMVLGAAFLLAYLLRFEFYLKDDDLRSALFQLSLVIPIQMLALYLFGVHKFIWRYISMREAKSILWALAAASVPILLLRLLLPDALVAAKVPLSIIVFNFCLSSLGLLGIRAMRREIHERNERSKTNATNLEKKSVLLIGAGRTGVMALSEIKSRGDSSISVKGFIDDDPVKLGAVINGIKVLGSTEAIPEIVPEMGIDHVIISMAQGTREDFQRILNICRNASIKVRVVPGLYELLEQKVTVSRIRDIEIEDLLGRSPIQLEKQSIEAFITGKTVMVTGAGGSIGSELVRQLAHCRPEKLILVERCEFALFQIEQELGLKFEQINFKAVIADVCDRQRMTKIFEKYNPQVVFHAAAHKHVPLMEINSSEALKNNVLGTELVGRLAGEYSAEAFVLISTDKAVKPTSIMGASKRAAELVIQEFNNLFATRFVAVRFGNVIGSNGSVIPTFKEQIKKGGPVTVTHPEMLRFFMTIPEATQLVMQAGALGEGGEIFTLDMGEPVRILDLARETIRLSGLRPDVDIKIEFTGMRPGEKLVEELESDKEQLMKTAHPKIFIQKIDPYSAAQVCSLLTEIQELCRLEDDGRIRTALTEYLPEANLNLTGTAETSETPAQPAESAVPALDGFLVARAA